jgi:hypothetical protein
MLAWAPCAWGSLAASEIEQLRHEVSTAQNVGHVRALVARPDLTSDEAGAAMMDAMSSTPIDAPHTAFLHELVFASASTPSRPILAVAVVRGLLARVDVLLATIARGGNRNAAMLAEVGQAYDFIEEIIAADEHTNVTDTARTECAGAIAQHIAHNASLLHPDEAVSWGMAHVRAQIDIALLDAVPETSGRRVDLASTLGLSGARRSALIELGTLVLDAGGSDARVAALRPLLERVPGAREGTAAIVFSDQPASRLRARSGTVVTIDAASTASLTEANSPWGNEVAPPPVDEATLAVVRDLTLAAVRRALEQRTKLRAAVEHDGGEAAVSTLAAMIEVDASRTIEAVAARYLAGKRESAARLSDAVGALAVFATAPKGVDGLAVPVGRGEAGDDGTRLTHLVLDASGAAAALQYGTHTWRIVRNDQGDIARLLRDGAPVNVKMLPNARPPAEQATSWSAAGLVFARLAGTPRAAVMSGPRVWVYGSGVSDAIVTPSPGDDVLVEADLRVNGGAAGIALRAVPGGARAFKGVSVLIVPGTTPRAALIVGDGTGVEIAAAPVVDLASGPLQHVRVSVRRSKVEARVGGATLEATLPEGFEHGDVALRAYAGASIEASAWKMNKP